MLLNKLAATENQSVRTSIETRLTQLGHVFAEVKAPKPPTAAEIRAAKAAEAALNQQ
jgi:hypothetical protein